MKNFITRLIALGIVIVCTKLTRCGRSIQLIKLRKLSVKYNFQIFRDLKMFSVGLYIIPAIISMGLVEISIADTRPMENKIDIPMSGTIQDQRIIPFNFSNQHYNLTQPTGEIKVATIDPGGTITDGVVDGTDLPRISVSSNVEQITEGGKITFTVSSNIAPSTDLSINLGFVIPLNVPIPTYLSQYPVIAVDYGLGERGLSVPSVTIKAGSNFAELPLQTADDTNNLGDIELTIEVLPPTGDNQYLASTTRNSFSFKVVIVDDELEMSISATNPTANLNSNANFALVASKVPKVNRIVNVRIQKSGSVSFLDDNMVPFSANLNTQTLQIPTAGLINNDQITLTVQPGNNYNVAASPNDSASVTVSDSTVPPPPINNTPEIFIGHKYPQVVEGNPAVFIIGSRNIKVTTNLTISINVTSIGSFLQNNAPTSFILNKNTNIRNLEIPTLDDQVDEANGKITVTISSGTGYNIARSPENSGFVNIIDNDDQSIEIAVAHVRSEVTEGSPARFVITSETLAPKSNLIIKINERRSGDFFNTSTATAVTLEAGDTYKRISITTVDDSGYEKDGQVSITIERDDSYVIKSAPHNSAIVKIKDNDIRPLKPEIHIAPRKLTVTEGNPAKFLFVSEDVIPTSQLIVNIKVTLTGNFFNTTKPTTHTFNQGDEFSYLDIPTINNEQIDEDGSVKIEVISGPNYFVADSPSNIATVRVLEGIVIPRIYVKALSTSINEGEIASFEIGSTTIAPTSNLVIKLIVTQTRSYYQSRLPDEITLAGGTKKVPLNMTTIDDDLVRGDGQMIVVVKTSTGYKPVSGNGTNKPTAEITIKNTDSPVEVQIFTTTAKITEGEVAQFEIRASRNVSVARMINFSVLVQGNFVQSFQSGVKKDFVLPLMTGKNFVPFAIQAIQDNIDEPNGTITFTLKSGTEYNVANAPLNSTIVIIEDDDGPPVISIANASSIIEGSKAVFPVTAVGTSIVDVVILFSLDEGNHDFLGGRTREIARLNAQSASTTLSVQTVADGFDESDGMITVSIDADPLTPDTYKVGTAKTAKVLVIDDDKPPEIFIANAPEIIEGNRASFTIFATNVASDPVTINISIDEGTNDYLLGIQPKTATLPAKVSHTILAIQTKGDEEDEPDGDIEVTILPDTKNPHTYVVGEKRTATGKVIDNDIFTFSLNSNQLRFNENESVQFSFLVSIISRRDIPISVELTESANYLEGGEHVEQFVVKAGARNSLQSIALDDDNLVERNGTVTATVLSDPSYKLEGKDNFSVLIVDNDDPPLISILVDSTTVNPKSSVDFKVVAEESITADELMINISVDQNSNYLKWRVPKQLMFEPLKQEKTFQLTTNQNFNPVDNGRIVISILGDASGSTKYRVNQNAKEIVIPVSNELIASQSEPQNLPRISIADSVVNSILSLNLGTENSPILNRSQEQNNPTFQLNSNLKPKPILPLVQIIVVSNSVDEGQPARFRVTSSVKLDQNITIYLTLNSAGNFTNSATSLSTEITKGTSEAIVVIPTIENQTAESDGFIELSILASANYQIGVKKLARVNITDTTNRIQRQQILESVNNEIIPGLFNASNQGSFKLATQRVDSAFAGGVDNSITFARSQNIPDFLTNFGGQIDNSDFEWNSLIYDSNFSLNLTSNYDSKFSTSVWGLGNSQDITGKFSNHSGNWSGEMNSAQLGIDSTYNNSLIGVMMSESDANVTINSEQETSAAVNAKYTRFQPYIGLNFPEWKTNTKILVSYGLFIADLNYENFEIKTIKNKTISAAIAGEKVLYSGKNNITGGNSNVSVNGVTSFAQYAEDLNLTEFSNMQKKYTRWSLGVNGTDNIETNKGTTIEPKISLGLASETLFPVTNWFDIEVSAGLKANVPIGLAVTGMTETRLRKPENGSRMSYLGLIEYDYGDDNLGMQLRIEPTWGETLADQRSSLLGEEYLGIIGNIKENSDDFNLRSSVRYSFDFFDERLVVTPFSSILYSNKYTGELSIGQRIHVDDNFDIELSASHNFEPEETDENKIQFAGKMRW